MDEQNWIRKVTLENVWPFRAKQVLTFKKGLNIVVGQERSGKTLLLRLLASAVRPGWQCWDDWNLRHAWLPTGRWSVTLEFANGDRYKVRNLPRGRDWHAHFGSPAVL